MSTRRLVFLLGGVLCVLLLIAGIARLTASSEAVGNGGEAGELPRALAIQARGESHEQKGERGGEAGATGPAQDAYDNRALPHKHIAYAQVRASRRAFERLTPSSRAGVDNGRGLSAASTWELLGPVTPTVPASSTYTGRATTVSGRVTGLAIAPTCVSGNCKLYVAAAGGGVWKTDDALATTPTWTDIWNGPASNAIGSIMIDPNNASTIWVGTGEPSGSSDSEAGVGLYKSTDGGSTWTLNSASVAISKDRGIGTIAIDPTDSNHILIGTDVARHGSSSVNGGRFTPPGAPKLAAYETTNGGSSWTKVLELPQDSVDPTSPNGSDFFAGGITKILFDPNDHNTVYASSFTSGLWRRTGGTAGTFAQIFHGQDSTDTFERTEFALADMGTTTRIWAGTGDESGYNPGELWRVNDSSDAAATLLASEDAACSGAAGTKCWKLLSSTTVGDDGFTSQNFCQDQCSYDSGVWSTGKEADQNLVVLQGAMRYSDIGRGPEYSNGGTVVRSTDAGVTFQDMTNDALNPPNGLHPDHRALVFDPSNSNIMFAGSDGGVVRIGPDYTDKSADCDSRSTLTSTAAKDTCKDFLRAIPTQLYPLNQGLPTLQFQSVTVSAKKPNSDLLGGTQDNGTWAFTCGSSLPCTTFETINGDGGQSAINAKSNSIRTHSYFNPYYDTNFDTNNPTGWDWISDSFFTADFSALLESFSFYPPLIQDPVNGGYLFTGGQHVWRTTDNGGPRATLDAHCNEFTGDFTVICGDWQMLATSESDGGDLTTGSASSSGKGSGYVVAVERARSDKSTMWVGTRRGRIFISQNANASSAAAVRFKRIDTATQPERFPSGISIDPNNPNHAFISFSGYEAYTPTQPGHVFEVTYNPKTKKATWKNQSKDLGDQPITDIEYVAGLKTLYAATDFGVLSKKVSGSSWHDAGAGLPTGAVYGLRRIIGTKYLYAATHGRGVWRFETPVCLVPNVVGKKLGAATSALTKAGCKKGKVSRAASKVTKGKVIKQSPKAGSEAAKNGKVNLTLSKGKKKRR